MRGPCSWFGHRALFGIALLCPPDLSSAQGPSWGYAEYAHVWARLQSDETGNGGAAQLSLPLGESLFFSASGTEVNAQFDDPSIPVEETIEGLSAGLGFHSTTGKAHGFGLLSYARKSRRVTEGATETREHSDGALLTVGARWLVRPYFSFEPEIGLGYFGDYDFDEFARVKIALRLVPHVWVAGGYSTGVIFGDSYNWSAGVRLTYPDSTSPRRRPRGAKVIAPASPDDSGPVGQLAPGHTLVAMRSLLLQQRPLAGAAEIATVPAGTAMTLQRSTQNDFGTWWYVSAGDQEGWIRETQLK